MQSVPIGIDQPLAIFKGHRKQGLSFSRRKLDVMYTRTREGHNWAAFHSLLPWPAAEVRVHSCHWTWTWPSFDVLNFFFNFFPCASLFWFFFQLLLLRMSWCMFMTQWSGSNYVQPGHCFLFKMAFSSEPTHFKKKQSFPLVNSSSLGWVIAKRESSSKAQRGVRMPGQRRACQLVSV